MPVRLSEHLNIPRDVFEDHGVFDSLIDYDSRLHIDPALIGICGIPEFQKANEKIAGYFTDILRLAKASATEGDVLWRTALKKLTFGEGLNSGLGYSQNGKNGSGIGKDTAANILRTVKEIVDVGIEDPRIFELVPLFESKIGPDRISDMFSIILKSEFIAYTRRMADEFGVGVPSFNGQDVVFVPRVMLSDLPVAEQWEDVQISAAYNENVRDTLNALIGKSWRKVAAEMNKTDLKDLLVKNPELLKELLSKYKARSKKGYDFELDHIGIMLWDVLGYDTAEQHPLDLNRFVQEVSADNVMEVVREIAVQYKKLIERNGLVEHIYDSNDDRRPERFPQLLFYAVADCYCKANRLDLNREINAGSGALDFKVSSGAAKVNLEIKYSSNPKLVEGYEKQLPAYNYAEGVAPKYSFYLILRVNKNQDHKIKVIEQTIRDRARSGIESPELIVVNAIVQPSASKR